MQVLLFSLFNGLLYGMLLFMLSSGLTLIFSMMGVLNFAHASFFMLGAYFAYEISRLIGFWPALFFAPLGAAVIGAVIERYGLRTVHKFGHVAELLFTFGLAFVIEELVQMIWGKTNKPYLIPSSMDFTLFTWQGLDYSAYRVFMLLTSVGIFVALYWLLTRTRVGLIIQAALSHPQMVGALGHNVPRIFMYTFGFGCGLAAIGGVLGGNVLGTEPAMAIQLGPIVFVVIVIGGLGSLGGALIASIFIGILTNAAVSYDVPFGPFFALFGVSSATDIGNDLVRMTSGSVSSVLPYLIMVLMLILRPRGLFGNRDV
ncbi:MAG: branched-chain amino acid ABC transporter permease [Candidatus Lambdaproteobacteria bacterium]|nr:branched-chain amino acid ABC transporter permease [Candidatus Lambdaproteobacteria bacterium]